MRNRNAGPGRCSKLIVCCTGIYFRHGASLKKEPIGLTPFAQADCYLFVGQMLEGPLLLHMSYRTNS